MKLRTKLIVYLLLIGIIPAAGIGLTALNNASKALEAEAWNKLTLARSMKTYQIEQHFVGLENLLTDVQVNLRFTAGIPDFAAAFPNGLESEDYKAVMEQRHNGLKSFTDANNFYDLFLIDTRGNVVYTMARESDLGANLLTGPLKDSGLAKCFKHSVENKKTHIQDFEFYAPSNEPAAFASTPIHNKSGELLGVAAFQVSLKEINKIMQLREGMGDTGETYLVGQDKLMRSDSFLDPENHTVQASFKNPQKGSVNTVAATAALAGKTGADIIIDYNGNPVLSAYNPIKVGVNRWALLAEIDEAEAFGPIKTLNMLMLSIGAGTIVVLLILIPILTKDVTKTVIRPLLSVIEGLTNASDQVTSASAQVASSSQSLSAGASQQAASLEETSSTLEEISSMTRKNVENTNQAGGLSKEALESVGKGSTSMGRMVSAIRDIKNSSDETYKIIKTIDEIAFQTNLLALNAAVEAARAGDAGRGFAVVAEEVRNLAMRSAEAAKNTNALIETSQERADIGVAVTEEVEGILKEIREKTEVLTGVVNDIASASREQSRGIEQVNSAMAQMDSVTQGNAANAEETAASSEELSSQAQQLMSFVKVLVDFTGSGGNSSIGASSNIDAGDHAHSIEDEEPKRLGA
ncbi:MAG: methyl-accepting chemotaxis protein [Deltaproteobacteria bacterium]|nr:methyl-accepting chemotaxis protein [Deltaproteobacteria bacterium]